MSSYLRDVLYHTIHINLAHRHPRGFVEEQLVRMTIVNGPRRYGVGGPDSEILAGLAALAAGSGIASGLATRVGTGGMARNIGRR